MRFELYFEVNAILFSSIIVSLVNRIVIVTISFILIIYLVAVTKFILFAYLFLNKLQLLHRYQNMQDSRNQVLAVYFCKNSSFTIYTFSTSPNAKSSESDLLFLAN